MPRVFTGKVVIPGDQLDAHFQRLAEAEAARKPFRSQLTGFKSEFIRDFDYSYDGKRLAIIRGHRESDVVLIRDS